MFGHCLMQIVEGLRTALISSITTDSHKLILVIADGMVKGTGNTLTTPEICLVHDDFVVASQGIGLQSYVAIVDGQKHHNMAKVYSRFTIMMTLPSNSRSSNACPSSLSLDVATLLKLTMRN